MAALSRLLRLLENLLARDRAERELDDELRSFVEMVTQENLCCSPAWC